MRKEIESDTWLIAVIWIGMMVAISVIAIAASCAKADNLIFVDGYWVSPPPVPSAEYKPAYAKCDGELIPVPPGLQVPQSCEDLKRWSDPLWCANRDFDYWALRTAYCRKVFKTKKQRSKCMGK